MNILHLKYAVEVAATGSINKAAENLYMGQPNLSRAIKDLEESLGITIFHRTPKGIHITDEGKEFLHYAGRILSQVEQVEKLYDPALSSNITSFSLCAPDASYISRAFTTVAGNADRGGALKLVFDHGTFREALNGIVNYNYGLGIIRFDLRSEKTVRAMLREKELESQDIAESEYSIIMHKNHPLAHREKITYGDLEEFTEILTSLSETDSFFSGEERRRKKICVPDKSFQRRLLSEIGGSFMWAEADEKISDGELVEKKCTNNVRKYKDVLIYRSDYRLTETDKSFMKELKKEKNNII